MKKFGLIGHPIGHSASPAVFSAGYKGKPYTYDLIEGEDFEESYRRFIESYDGINVTAPFKEPAFARADLHSPECEVIGATNLLVKTPEGVKAYNSDYYGIIFSILIGYEFDVKCLPANPSPAFCRGILYGWSGLFVKPRKALVVGCGGAGKAAAVAAVNLGFETTLMNRTIDKATAVAERITSAISMATVAKAQKDEQTPTETVGQLTVRPIEELAKCFAQSDLIIYTLPCPIAALEEIADNPAFDATDEEAFPISYLPKVFIEANYRDPAFTPELTAKILTRYPEANFIRGNIWHLYQAWSGYALFTGETPDLAAMAAVDK